MYPEPLLVTCTQAYLDGRGNLPEVLDCAEKTRQSVEQHAQQTQARLDQEPAHVRTLVQSEIQCWNESCADFLKWARIAALSEGSSEQLEALCAGLPISSQRLHFDEFRLEQALWISRGPTTLAAVNRALAAARQGLDLAPVCAQEAGILQASLVIMLEGYPAELQPHLAPVLEHIVEWLEQPSAEPQWQTDGEALGKELAAFDLAYLMRGYAGAPTTYAPLNLALNACWLQGQGLVAAELTAYCLSEALRQLESLPPPAEGDVPEIFEDMQQLLTQLLKQCQRGEDLTALHGAALEVAQEFQEALQEPSEEEGLCPVCHQPQPLGTIRCSLCGSKFTAVAGADPPQERLERVLALAEELLTESEGANALENELKQYRQDLDKARQFKDADYQEILAEFEEGLDCLEEFLTEPDRELLTEGSAFLRQAEAKLRRWRDEHP